MSKTDDNQKKSKFAEVLSQLRKERGISQKKAASDLGISQALLSHYEKGIRECGLDFVIKCSEYYNVTTDYLLGVSESRNGVSTSSFCEDGSTVANLTESARFLMSIFSTSNDYKSAKYIYDYYTLCLYRGALTMAKAGMLPKELFKIDFTLGRELANAAIAIEDAKFGFIEDRSRTGSDSLDNAALKSLVEQAEEKILTSFYLE